MKTIDIGKDDFGYYRSLFTIKKKLIGDWELRNKKGRIRQKWLQKTKTKTNQNVLSFEAHAFAVDLGFVQMWQSNCNCCMLWFNSINHWGTSQLLYYELRIIYIASADYDYDYDKETTIAMM